MRGDDCGHLPAKIPEPCRDSVPSRELSICLRSPLGGAAGSAAETLATSAFTISGFGRDGNAGNTLIYVSGRIMPTSADRIFASGFGSGSDHVESFYLAARIRGDPTPSKTVKDTQPISRNCRLAGLYACGYRARMAEPSHDSVTRLLQRWSEGDSAALDRLLPLVYADLRRLASRELRSAHGHATLQTTALVHDVILRLLGRPPSAFDDRSHLLNASARMMRQVLVDRARKAQAEKRGGRWIRDDFSEALELPIPDGTDLAMLDAALVELERAHQRMSQVVELRYFMGLSVAEIADTLGVDERTIHRDWSAAREWLRERLDRPT